MKRPAFTDRLPHPTRRGLLVGGGAGVGLLLAWGFWPRRYLPSLNTLPGEVAINGFIKIGTDGHVTIVVPQAEMGQGITTALPMILADELGADWRTIAVEPAPINPIYANDLLALEDSEDLPGWLRGAGRWVTRQSAIRGAEMVTAGSTSIRGFEQRYREAGAMARALLCKAAGLRWGADWNACDTEAGFVTRGEDRLRFAELAEEAAALDPPADIPLRATGAGGIVGESVPRLDLPAKVDGSLRFAADVRLPGLVYASVRHGPFGTTGIDTYDRTRGNGLIDVVEGEDWIAGVARSWWTADRALDAMAPRFDAPDDRPDDGHIAKALDEALAGADPGPDGATLTADYSVGLAAHAALEPLTATARLTGDRLELWLPTQAPTLARSAAAQAAGIDEAQVTIYPMPVGDMSGRKLSVEAAVIATRIAARVGKPVQLIYSRAEENRRDDFRSPVRARLSARLGPGGRPVAWSAAIAAPSSATPWRPVEADEADPTAVAGARPPYDIPEIAIEHRPAAIGLPTGYMRGGAHGYTAFFTESFVDDLARKADSEPLGYRMQMLGRTPRLARCLAAVGELGEWQGGIADSGQGLACHSAFGSHIAMLVEARIDTGRIAVDKVIAVVDCGRIIHPDIVRQMIEGGILAGLSTALAKPVRIDRGLPAARKFDATGLPRLADTPEIVVELIETMAPPGGVSGLAVPPLAPALANALFTITGKRLRALPVHIA